MRSVIVLGGPANAAFRCRKGGLVGTEQESVVGASVADAEVVTCVGPLCPSTAIGERNAGKIPATGCGGSREAGTRRKKREPLNNTITAWL